MPPTPPRFSAPFPPKYRASGVLLHVTSLPSRFGVGDVGPSAFKWVDQLADAGQTWWQVLPLGPTGYGHSPYQALSSFAANPLVISPDQLIEDGLLKPADANEGSFPSSHVDFERVIPFKERLLARAWKNFKSAPPAELGAAFNTFREEKGPLQDEPALFTALRARFAGKPFQEWPAGLAWRDSKALKKARRECAEAMDQFRFGQFLLLRHWTRLKEYANRRGVRLLGDLPIFVSPDSSDVWANPELFLLDNESKPRVVAGVPPDYFSADGQLWGNPVYDWEALQQTDYRWWIRRLQARLEYLDAIRIDHFRGFEAAWHVPAGAPTAATGRWVPGPGADFFDKARRALGGLPLLAEDLGIITPAVTALRDQFQLPGMRVLQFGFNGDPNNPHLPHQCGQNTVVYTGTHDNDTTRGWYDGLTDHERWHFWRYLQRPPGQPPEAVWELIRLAWSSGAALAITPFQDLLGLGSAARMNVPGCADGQWRWRCSENVLNDPVWQRLSELTQTAGRLAGNSTELERGPDGVGERATDHKFRLPQ
ncbi:MAG: 4-alpha-glucanotransferase [Verrucomicrobiia bacterium]